MTARDIVMSAAGNSGDSKTYIEDVFSTYLYAGNDTTQTINNGIDLAGKGGMVWIKDRTSSTNGGHLLTHRTPTISGGALQTNTSNASINADGVVWNSSGGFNLDTSVFTPVNWSGRNYASWTFRKAPKFFDVVAGTGGTSNINHNLGSVPAMVILKQTATTDDWYVFHRSSNGYFKLNTTDSRLGSSSIPGIAASGSYLDATATTFNVQNFVNTGNPFVAYLFAHDTTTDGLIQCGSYTGNGSTTGPEINLGWEPQYVLVKKASGTGEWWIMDNMRGLSQTSTSLLHAESSAPEDVTPWVKPLATGFQPMSGSTYINQSGGTYIYMAIRRGPMKTPTDGTKVYKPSNTKDAKNVWVSDFPVDFGIIKGRSGSPTYCASRLVGSGVYMNMSSTSAESTGGGEKFDNNYGLESAGWSPPDVLQLFRRAPGFFDVVCYTGTGTKQTINHNLGVTPELIICKDRSRTSNWLVYDASVGNPTDVGFPFLVLNRTDPRQGYYSPSWVAFGNQKPDSTAFYVNDNFNSMNNAGVNSVAYLFASCPGVSKVGTYTGNGSSQTINCGFTNGARFFLVKATSTTGSWWVYDSARGIVAAADPALQLNSTAAEVTSADAVDPDATGIIVNQEATCSINANGVSYIYLAIA